MLFFLWFLVKRNEDQEKAKNNLAIKKLNLISHEYFMQRNTNGDMTIQL